MTKQDFHQATVDPAAQAMLIRAANLGIRTGWDRFAEMQDSCAFGSLGLCCRHCMMGPCRIDPFGEGPQRGVCGISADAMVARNLCRMVASGTSAHSDHAAHIVEVLELIRDGKASTFSVKDPGRLRALAMTLGLGEEAIAMSDAEPDVRLLGRVIDEVSRAFASRGRQSIWLQKTLSKPRHARLSDLGLLPSSIDPAIRETMHRTHMGVDADPTNLLFGALRCAVADYLGMDIASRLSDILLGGPQLRYSQSNLGVLDADAVNVAVHGHNPLVAESILRVACRYQERARALGAQHGLNIVGICCTGSEVLLRQGIPLCTNAASQELAILTGALELVVVDVQCVMPSLVDVCECFHTRIATTMSIAKIPGALHVEFTPESAERSAEQLLELALESYGRRNPKLVAIPPIKQESLVGFSPEGIVELLSQIDSAAPLRPLVDQLSRGSIYGVALLAGCNNYRVAQDSSIVTLAERLLCDNVLVVATGCAAGALAKRGLCSPDATARVCGSPLAGVLTQLGETAALGRPLPPVWHMGSCVDNSRAARLCMALADYLGVDTDRLPVVASAPEAMSEKSLAIGTWALALGLTTHIGVLPPVGGGKLVSALLTHEVEQLLGARFIIETDPVAAHRALMTVLGEKRARLGLAAIG